VNIKMGMLRGGAFVFMSSLTLGCHSPESRPQLEQESDGGAPSVTYPEPGEDQANIDAGAPDSGGNINNDEPNHEFGAPPPPTQDYVLDAEMATSKATGLVWLRSSFDTSTTGGSCVLGCDKLTAAGYDDWRAPTLDELKTILVNRSTCPLIDEDAFPITPCTWFLSSDPAGDPNNYLMLSFYSGEVKSRLDVYNETGFICRCVR
jgi:Protein of unknown function (DUF1566)